MKIILGADVVVTDSNRQLFADGNAEEIVGKELLKILYGADYNVFNLEMALTDKALPIKKVIPHLSVTFMIKTKK